VTFLRHKVAPFLEGALKVSDVRQPRVWAMWSVIFPDEKSLKTSHAGYRVHPSPIANMSMFHFVKLRVYRFVGNSMVSVKMRCGKKFVPLATKGTGVITLPTQIMRWGHKIPEITMDLYSV